MTSPPGSLRPARLDTLPPRLPPVLYFLSAHLFLIAAFALAVCHPATLAGFFYQPPTVAIVHLITLGWISAAILGAIYIVGPMALRMPMPARRSDYAAWGLFVIGAAGMASHFWIDSYAGMLWSAGMAVLGILYVATRVLRGLVGAPIVRPVKMHVALAFLNLLAAAAAGMLIGLHKRHPFLPGGVLGYVYGHAHLAALGWAGMMVFGVGYRLLPMVLPAAMPHGRLLYASGLLLEAGAVGLFVCFVTGSRFLVFFALAAAAGFAVFFRQVAWMRRNARRSPAGLPRPDFGVAHVVQAMLYAGLCAALGVVLSVAPVSDWSGRAAAAYGVFGLIGFLAQIVLGFESRILPMFAAYHANLSRLCDRPPVMPHDMPVRRLQVAIFVLWTAGVPALAWGLSFEAPAAVAAGAGALLMASILGGVNGVVVLRHAFGARTSPEGAPPESAAGTPRGS